VRTLFLNPWERFIGPNRYLAEMLGSLPGLAAGATIVFDRETEAADEYRHLGCRVLYTPLAAQVQARLSPGNVFGSLSRHLAGFPSMTRLIAGEAPAVVVSNSEQIFLGGMVARRLRMPHVKIFHALTFEYRLGGRPALLRRYLKLIAAGADRVVAVSETMRGTLLRHGLAPGRVATIPNPIRVDALADRAAEPLPGDLAGLVGGRFPVILNAGVLFPTKGQDRLVEALPGVRRAHPEMLCLLAGRTGADGGMERTGAYAGRLRRRVAELGLDGHVRFLGDVACLPALMRRADIYVQPSRTESFGRAVAEALCCGTPAVVFDAGAMAETAGPGGMVVADGDIPGLTAAILSLAADPGRRRALASAGREHVRARFDAGGVARRFAALLEGLAGEGGRGSA
jgi:glycosyltransferase involved in cell wall biosynthesis